MQRYGRPPDLPLRLLPDSSVFLCQRACAVDPSSSRVCSLLPVAVERWGAGLSPYLTPEAEIGVVALCMFLALLHELDPHSQGLTFLVTGGRPNPERRKHYEPTREAAYSQGCGRHSRLQSGSCHPARSEWSDSCCRPGQVLEIPALGCDGVQRPGCRCCRSMSGLYAGHPQLGKGVSEGWPLKEIRSVPAGSSFSSVFSSWGRSSQKRRSRKICGRPRRTA